MADALDEDPTGAVGRRAVLGAGAAGVALGLLPRAARAATPAKRITAPAGIFIGEGQTDGVTTPVWSFRGIRYATAERFRAPRPYATPGRERGATAFGPVCPQTAGAYGPQSEDCLHLNVWSANPAPRAKLPVVLYIHGGAYTAGSVTDPLNDGAALAGRGDVVVVTVNHRLNAFGYLYLARLDPRFPDSGNAGQLDLICALRWVRDNIAAFGGDPARIMLFGQSGGGAKIATLTGMPAATGLFHRAATMSGQQVTAQGPLHATERTRAFLDAVGVNPHTLQPLLDMPAAKLVEGLRAPDPIIAGGLSFAPVLDMTWLTRHPFWPDANPIGRSIPMILGNTHDETRGFTAPDTVESLTWETLPDRLAPELRIDVLPEWVVGEYRKQFPDWPPAEVFYAASTAGRSWRGQVIEAEARARAGAPAWVYQVDFASRTDPRRGAFHTIDIPLVFGTLGAAGSQTGTGPDARAASAAMQGSFVAFARTGDPNHAGLPPWPRYDLAARSTMIFDATSRIEHDPRRWQRELFARIPYIQPGT
ncbi:carboxylesterase family protein [Sphingomonas sp. H39-1-10]|uniref:carboxylesterase/lipase family protein n=1 Tax=Sphingomonas pollutisoli TaxID=3030829 RepID=UPI0023B9FCD3|nr:carboxylesterase family protein [Sphingomonas pollutisoli]MDF0489320.1 carboxylesterase family protein [Sphingomonas pollutisoli]